MFSMCLCDNLEVGFSPSETERTRVCLGSSPNPLHILWSPDGSRRRQLPSRAPNIKAWRSIRFGGFQNETEPCSFPYSSGYSLRSLMNGASILKLFKLFIILTLVLKQKNNAKINGFLKLLMWGGCIQISLTLSKSLTWETGESCAALVGLWFFSSLISLFNFPYF